MRIIKLPNGIAFVTNVSASEAAVFCERLRAAMEHGDTETWTTEMWTDVLILETPPDVESNGGKDVTQAKR